MKSMVVMAAVVSLCILMISGCGTKETPGQGAGTAEKAVSNEKPKTIIVATVNNYLPFEFVKDGKLVGFDIDMMTAIAKIENLQIDWKPMKFDGFIPALQANQVDAEIAFMTAAVLAYFHDQIRKHALQNLAGKLIVFPR